MIIHYPLTNYQLSVLCLQKLTEDGFEEINSESLDEP